MANDYGGIYLAYFTGEYGTSLGIFLFKDGNVSGGDIGGARYFGKLVLSEDETCLIGTIKIIMPDGGQAITGASSKLPVSYDTSVSLSLPLEEQAFHEIQTLTGPVNVRFERTVDL